MEFSSNYTVPIFWNFVCFCFGIILTVYVIFSVKPKTISISNISSVRKPLVPSNCSSTNFTIDDHNINYFYEEYYRYYEINQQWLKKTYLGIQFLQNPNDAITIGEILAKQDIDLVIETGSFQGASALFFASIMYQYRYNSKEKAVRPFKVITIDISQNPKSNIERYPLLSQYIIFVHASSDSETAKSIVNITYNELKPKNVFISLDGDHHSVPVYKELVYYEKYAVNIGNYILVQDTRLSRKWHTNYCFLSVYDGPCDGPLEGLQWFLKNEGKQRFVIDATQEYLFSTHHQGWLKRIAP